MRRIFNEFLACELNVLSALLRRGGQKEGYAELRAICEPRGARDAGAIFGDLSTRIDKIGQEFDAALKSYEAKPAEEVIYVPPPSQVTPHGMRPVFLAAHHGAEGDPQRQLDEMVRRSLKEDQWWPLDGTLLSGMNTESPEACSLMERCEAALIVITGLDAENSETLKLNVMHELGYLRALHKPVLILSDQSLAQSFAGCPRNELCTFAEISVAEDAFGTQHPQSVAILVRNWSRDVHHRY